MRRRRRGGGIGHWGLMFDVGCLIGCKCGWRLAGDTREWSNVDTRIWNITFRDRRLGYN